MERGTEKPWTITYAPKSLKEVIGQESLAKLKGFVEAYRTHKKKAAFLYGPSGTGKTCSVYALARDVGFEVIEVNASDIRNKEHIETFLSAATKQRSLFSQGKIILIDEVDGISGTYDRGGIPSLIKMISESFFPVVITGNDPWDHKFGKLRTLSLMLAFEPVPLQSMVLLLSQICHHEGIHAEPDTLKTLARRSAGDVRAAITDLYALTRLTRTLNKKTLEELDDRNREESLPMALVKVFKTNDPLIAKDAFENINEDLDTCLLWIDENLPYEYTTVEARARAYDALSKADIFNRRIRRWQHWRFLVYVSALLTAGVAVAKDEKLKEFVPYHETKRLLKIWMANQKYQKRKVIAGKIARKTHTSTRRALQDTLPYLQIAIQKNKTMAKLLQHELDLDEEEMQWLKK
ncbi:replication factor C large subunit [Candidatus Woesearchaeota archaeon]|nr:replication factor C large subunit [Candidatus Woesearchaeota archaeon]